MASPTARVTIAKPGRANGVLSVPASATQRGPRQASESHAPRARSAPSARQKICIRRLPPGLTQAEFEEALGDEWKSGGEKVGWANYKPGKISKDPAKPSRPSRAYLHLKKAEHAGLLDEKIRSTAFNDAKNSGNDSCLLGPPSVEFAPFQKIPSNRPRKDARQSTIDQDPEFIDFLESLTNPVTKSSTVDQENESVKNKEKVTVTPLIQYLRDKKANKGKEALNSAKGGKHGRQDPKEGKANANAGSKSAPVATSSNKKRSAQAVKVEQAARDAVKVLNKQAASSKSPPAPAPSPPAKKATTPNVTPNSTANAVLADKKRERGSASAAAKILQRDLGLTPGGSPAGRGSRGTKGARVSDTGAKAGAASQQQTATKADQSTLQDTLPAKSTEANPSASPTELKPAPSILQKPTSPPTGPAASRASNSSASQSTKSTPTSPSTSTQAFLKHANPSQGITEPLLEETFGAFGTVKKVEIDKKKGFAYVDFENVESLQKAIKASPIKVAQGQVVVLERKTGPSLQVRGGSGGGGGGGGGGRGGSPMAGNRGGGSGMGNTPRVGNANPNANTRGGNGTTRGGGRGATNRGAGGGNAQGKNTPGPATAASSAASPTATPTTPVAAAAVGIAPQATTETSTPAASSITSPET